MSIEAIYLHIPFCISKCHYCDFVSYPMVGARELVSPYCGALQKEIAMAAQYYAGSLSRIKSVYVGGGTPTSLPAEELTMLMKTVFRCFSLAGNCEITVECNPGTVDDEYFRILKKAGVNRVSIGAQAFQKRLLAAAGRIHSPEDIERTVIDAKKAGFKNINLDLIYGLPGQTFSDWQESLRKAVSLQIEHLAAYGLKLDGSCLWARELAAGNLQIPDQDFSADLLEKAIDYLSTEGYVHYEISNFARPGFSSRHNRVYWKNGDYLGLGVASSSHFNNIRWTNSSSLDHYLRGISGNKFPVVEKEELDQETVWAETMFLGLRLREGVNIDQFEQRFGVTVIGKYGPQVEKLKRYGLLKLSGRNLQLTHKGIFLANEVFLEFLP